MPKAGYYAVRVGRKPGIYGTWDECKEQVLKYSNARYKKFYTRQAAQDYIDGKIKIKKKKDQIIDTFFDKGAIVAYTDGACDLNGSEKAKGGIGVYWSNGEYESLSERLPDDNQTSNRAEIYAVIRALEICKDREKILEIKTDSMYVVNAYNKWIPNWIKNNWMRTEKKQPVKNRDLFERMMVLINLRKRVIISYVKGHSGIDGNEKADKLATDSLL